MDLPTVSLNFAISADGKISSIDRRPSDWTSKDDFERLLALRLEADALLVGRGTLVADAMNMTIPARLNPARKQGATPNTRDMLIILMRLSLPAAVVRSGSELSVEASLTKINS